MPPTATRWCSGSGSGSGCIVLTGANDRSSSAPPSAAATCSSSSSTSSHEHGGNPELAATMTAAGGGRGRQSAPCRSTSGRCPEPDEKRSDGRPIPTPAKLIRLTTGCVPIMKDGRDPVMLVVPEGGMDSTQGGWESDETLAESAIRETYEEAGVTGTLGPVLSDVEYETRKAKKRRLERESLIKTMREEQNGGLVLPAPRQRMSTSRE